MYVLITVDRIMGRLVLNENGNWTQWSEGCPLPRNAERFANYATGKSYLARVQEGKGSAWVNPSDTGLAVCYVGLDTAQVSASAVRPYALQYRYAA